MSQHDDRPGADDRETKDPSGDAPESGSGIGATTTDEADTFEPEEAPE
jgi:hypothetical protein